MERTERIREICERLIHDGVDVVADLYELSHGADIYAFMERCVNDSTITRVMFCDRLYCEKANGRLGGVGKRSRLMHGRAAMLLLQRVLAPARHVGYNHLMSRVAVKPELIRWARERSGFTESVLAERFPKYVEWESGQTQPTLRQLEDLAKKTMTPFGYFFLPEPPEERLPIPDFRTLRDRPVRRPSPNLLETIHTMQRRQDWMRDLSGRRGC